MDQELWTEVDRYITQRLVPADPSLEAALTANAAARLPAIDVAPNQGKFLYLLALAQGARRILEIGTLGGYSTIWLARALPRDGRLVTLELDAKHARIAQSNLQRAGLSGVTEVRVGPAGDSLAQLHREGAEPFDFVFLDADKSGYPDYLEWALKLTRRGSMIIADNVVRDGAVADTGSQDAAVKGVQRMIELLAVEPRLSSTAIQTVGSKGYDGFTLSVVTTD